MLTFPEFDDSLLNSGSFFSRKAAEMIAAERVATVRKAIKAVKPARRFVSVARHGGLLFFRVGRFGGSVYFAKAMMACVAVLCIPLVLGACSPDEPKQPQQAPAVHRVASDSSELIIRGGQWTPQREVTDSGVTILRGR